MDGCSILSRHAAVELDWADGTYTFRLGLKEIEELEEKCDLGIYRIWQTLHPSGSRDFRSTYLVNAIRLGLLGGGMDAAKALVLVRKYIDERPIEESRDAAFAVVSAALVRVHGEDLKQASEDGEANEGKPEKAEPILQPSTEAPA
jgi:hypothetical protein